MDPAIDPSTPTASVAPTPGRAPGPAEPGPADATRLVALAALEPASRGLISTWLAEDGWTVVDGDRIDAPPRVLIVEVSYPRSLRWPDGPWPGQRFPQTPVIVVSPTIVAGTPSRGDAARRLGVAAVLAMPVAREALLAAVRDLAGCAR